MGPRRYRRGNVKEKEEVFAFILASMGPRRYRRGNQPQAILTNAQDTLLQWGRDVIVAEMTNQGKSRGKPSELQWGRDVIVAEIAL